jgi:uncharacterized membrane protein
VLKAEGRSGSAGGEDDEKAVVADIDEGMVEEICGLVAGDGVMPGVEDNAMARTTLSVLCSVHSDLRMKRLWRWVNGV